MDEIDKTIDDILLFAGSRLKNYSIKANVEGMRSVMRDTINSAVEKYKQDSDESISNERISILISELRDVFPWKNKEMPIEALACPEWCLQSMINNVDEEKAEYISMLEALKQVWNDYEIDDCKSPTANKVWAAIIKADPSLKGIR